MPPHTRATVAASAYAFVRREKVAGLYDHAAGRHLRIAAESRGSRLQGLDGDRSVRFGGTLPDIHDAGTAAFFSIAIDGARATGWDRGSSGAFTAEVTPGAVQVYDHAEAAWFAFSIPVA